MALFGKNKGDAPGNNGSAQNGDAPKTDNGAFDFDSIARDLEAQDGPSPFDSLLSKPVGEGDNIFDMNQLPSIDDNAGGSAFDFPETPLEEISEAPKRNVIASSSSTDLDNLDDLFGAPSGSKSSPASVVPDSFPDMPLTAPSTKAKAAARTSAPTPVAAPVPEALPPSPAPSAKKPLPLIPILGVAAVLVLGGAGWFFTQSSVGPDADTDVVDAVPIATPLGNPAVKPPVADGPSTVPTTSAAALKPPIGVKPAMPSEPVASAPGTSMVPPRPSAAVRPPTPPMPSGAPAASTDIDPEVQTQLKNLWEQGKNAKDRKDYASARLFWEQALKIKPGHPGFQESIDKLPK